MAKRPHTALDQGNFALSILMAVALGVEGGLVTEIIKGEAKTAVWTGAVLILAMVVGLGFVLSDSIQRWIRRNRQFQSVRIAEHVTRAQALVVFVSMKQGRNSARDAAFYHAEADVLRHLFLITSPEAQADADWVRQEVGQRFPRVKIYPNALLSDIYSIMEAKEEVEKLRRQIVRSGLAANDIICDFTGLTKHMSAGMILACAPKEARLQYMHPKRFLSDGRADSEAGPSRPVEVVIAYQLEEEA